MVTPMEGDERRRRRVGGARRRAATAAGTGQQSSDQAGVSFTIPGRGPWTVGSVDCGLDLVRFMGLEEAQTP